MSILTNCRGVTTILALFLFMALCADSAGAEEADDARVGDGTGAVMTFDDLDDVTPHLESSRSPRAASAIVAEAAVEPGQYYYLDESGNLIQHMESRIQPDVPVASPSEYYGVISSEPAHVHPGPGQIVVLSEHDSWPVYEGAGSTGYWDRGHTITGDPAYMSYYERNFGWGLGSGWYAGPRFDRGHVPSHMRVPRGRAGGGFQERFPGRLPARRDSPDPMERREARRGFFRDNAAGRAADRTPGAPRSRPPGSEGRRPGR